MTDKRIPSSRLREVWNDPSLTTGEAAVAVGLSRSSLWRRAKALGLAPRRKGNVPAITDEALFRRMWAAEVGIAEIAAHFGCHWQTPSQNARRLGLPLRACGGHRRPKTVAEFFAEEAERRLFEGLAERARVENAALRRFTAAMAE